MFDIGFWEICLIALVALVVIGPERLPKAARVAGMWWGKMNRMVSSVKQEIKEELRAEEMRQDLKQQASALEEVKGAMQETREALDDFEKQARLDTNSNDQASQASQLDAPQVEPENDIRKQ